MEEGKKSSVPLFAHLQLPIRPAALESKKSTFRREVP